MKKLEKLDRLPPYVFAEVNRIKDDARSKGKDIIDFGMGNPASPTPKHIVDKLIENYQKFNEESFYLRCQMNLKE